MPTAHETGAQTRTLHLYTDSEDQNAAAAVAGWCRRVGAGHVVEPDPAWRAARRLG